LNAGPVGVLVGEAMQSVSDITALIRLALDEVVCLPSDNAAKTQEASGAVT
jgi:hypothetical protein